MKTKSEVIEQKSLIVAFAQALLNDFEMDTFSDGGLCWRLCGSETKMSTGAVFDTYIEEIIDMENYSKIEPDNEKPYQMKTEDISKKEPIGIDYTDKELANVKEKLADLEKPYLYFEGEKYYFGEEYEFRDSTHGKWQTKTLGGYDRETFISDDLVDYGYIRKIDHTSKYKKLLLELKQQAEKDGVNLKELI